MLLGNGDRHGLANLSCVRLFGKMFVLRDVIARGVAGKNNRAINAVVHNVASTAL